MKHYLIGYITQTQTTKEAAQQIALQLENNSSQQISIEVCSLETIKNLETYDKIILGSPIHGMRVMPEFSEFLSNHKEQLSGRLQGLYVVSYLYPTCRTFWKKLILRGIQRLSRSHGVTRYAVFGGKLPEAMPTFVRFIFGTPDGAPLDSRDTQEIDRWVNDSLELN